MLRSFRSVFASTLLPLLALPTLAAPAVPAESKPAPATIASRTAGLTRQDGLLPLYWDARAGQLLLEVARWDEDVLYGAGLAGGAGIIEAFLDRGQGDDLGLCRFERVGPRVLLRQRQVSHLAGVDSAESSRAALESFPDSVLASLPVVAEEGARVLVDATEFVLRDTQVLGQLRGAGQGDWKQDAGRSALQMERTGSFPRNTEIEVVLTFVSDNVGPALGRVLPDGRTLSLRVHHTFLARPEPGYRPRELDPRVGFFTAPVLAHSSPVTEPLERYLVQRWRLEKKDPAAAVSEPVEPIVLHLDRGFPEPERSAVREGALWWNRAFEAAGLRHAIVVRDLPEGATFLDARYSGIEWINRAERGWSVGQVRSDPRTGQVLHAVARIDSHRRRTTARFWENFAPALRPSAAEPEAGGDLLGEREEDLVLQRLRYLAAHEVGHTLGLHHNWAGTTFGWGSVMDYLAANAQLREDGTLDLTDAYPRAVGSYDLLAIRWGYTPGADAAALEAMVKEALAAGVVYPYMSDARWAEYDWGADPVAWLATTQKVRRVILDRFGPAQLAAGRPLHDLQARFSFAYLYHRFGIQAAQQYVGGQYQVHAVKGDGQKPVAWVPAARQREALALLLATLEPKELDVPDRIALALVPATTGTAETRERFPSEAGQAFSVTTAARILAGLVVHPLLEPERAARLCAAAGEDELGLDEMLERLLAATWAAPLATSPRQAALRRVAQRVVLDALMDLGARADAAPEVRAAVFAHLTRLQGSLKARHTPDEAGEAHFRLAERDLGEYLRDPQARSRRPPRLPVPPGRPIG